MARRFRCNCTPMRPSSLSRVSVHLTTSLLLIVSSRPRKRERKRENERDDARARGLLYFIRFVERARSSAGFFASLLARREILPVLHNYAGSNVAATLVPLSASKASGVVGGATDPAAAPLAIALRNHDARLCVRGARCIHSRLKVLQPDCEHSRHFTRRCALECHVIGRPSSSGTRRNALMCVNREANI